MAGIGIEHPLHHLLLYEFRIPIKGKKKKQKTNIELKNYLWQFPVSQDKRQIVWTNGCCNLRNEVIHVDLGQVKVTQPEGRKQESDRMSKLFLDFRPATCEDQPQC